LLSHRPAALETAPFNPYVHYAEWPAGWQRKVYVVQAKFCLLSKSWGIKMPIYEYRCTACSFQEEYLQKISEPTKTVCPSCGKEAFRKLLSAVGFQLKGSGWYATDFRNSGSGKSAEAKESKSETKSDTTVSTDKGGAEKAVALKPSESTATETKSGSATGAAGG